MARRQGGAQRFTCELKRGTHKTLITVWDRAGNSGEGESRLMVH